jgi:hypothetical protein
MGSNQECAQSLEGLLWVDKRDNLASHNIRPLETMSDKITYSVESEDSAIADLQMKAQGSLDNTPLWQRLTAISDSGLSPKSDFCCMVAGTSCTHFLLFVTTQGSADISLANKQTMHIKQRHGPAKTRQSKQGSRKTTNRKSFQGGHTPTKPYLSANI